MLKNPFFPPLERTCLTPQGSGALFQPQVSRKTAHKNPGSRHKASGRTGLPHTCSDFGSGHCPHSHRELPAHPEENNASHRQIFRSF